MSQLDGNLIRLNPLDGSPIRLTGRWTAVNLNLERTLSVRNPRFRFHLRR